MGVQPVRRTALFALLLMQLALSLSAHGQVQSPAPAQNQAPNHFESLTLSKAFEIARDGNRAIKAAARQVEIASAEVYRANVRPNPTLTGQVGNTQYRQFGIGGTDRSVRVDQLVERGGKRELRTRQAQALEQASRWDLADTMRQQRVQLSALYFELAANQELLDLGKENLAAYQRLIDAAERRRNAGDLAAVDVSRLKVEAGRAANEVRAAQAAISQAQLSLAAALGDEASAARIRSVDPLPSKAELESVLGPGAGDRSTSMTSAIERRADVLASLARVKAADEARALAQSLQARDVSVGLQTQNNPSTGGPIFAIGATIPLLINNDYSADIAKAAAEREAANDELQRIRATVRSDIDRAYAQYAAARDRALRLLNSTLPDAAQVVTAFEFAFSRGAATLTDLFDARRQRAAVRVELIAALADYAKARAGYDAAVSSETAP